MKPSGKSAYNNDRQYYKNKIILADESQGFENPGTLLKVLILVWMRKDKVKYLQNKNFSGFLTNEKSVTRVCRMCDVKLNSLGFSGS